MKSLRIFCLLVFFSGSIVFLSNEMAIAAYPEKGIEFSAGGGPGSGLDTLCRMVSKTLSETGLVKRHITVINKPGGFGGNAVIDVVKNRANDQYTIGSFSTVVMFQVALKKSVFELKDIIPLVRLYADYGVIAVRNDSKYKTIRDLWEDLRKDPGAASFAGSSQVGGVDHSRVAMATKPTGIPPKTLKYVAYTGGGGECLSAVLGGHVSVFVGEVGEIAGQVEAGTLRPLVVLSNEKLPGVYANAPLSKDVGIDGISPNWRGFYGPPGMKKDVIEYWVETFLKMEKTKQWKDILKKMGSVEYVVSGQGFVDFLIKEMEQYRGIAKEITGL